jgi:hypothetical protein
MSSLNKPIDLDELLDVVASAVGRCVPFDASPAAGVGRTERQRAKLQAAGAQEIHLPTRREWANFKTADGTLVQMYWWQRDGVYQLMCHPESGGRLEQVGRFHDLDAAIVLGMSLRRQDT